VLPKSHAQHGRSFEETPAELDFSNRDVVILERDDAEDQKPTAPQTKSRGHIRDGSSSHRPRNGHAEKWSELVIDACGSSHTPPHGCGGGWDSRLQIEGRHLSRWYGPPESLAPFRTIDSRSPCRESGTRRFCREAAVALPSAPAVIIRRRGSPQARRPPTGARLESLWIGPDAQCARGPNQCCWFGPSRETSRQVPARPRRAPGSPREP
jgi:hypothetical protein